MCIKSYVLKPIHILSFFFFAWPHSAHSTAKRTENNAKDKKKHTHTRYLEHREELGRATKNRTECLMRQKYADRRLHYM